MSSKFINDLIRWLVGRQTLMLQEDEESNVVDEEPSEPTTQMFPPKFHVTGAYPAKMEAVVPSAQTSIEVSPGEIRWVGVNGRCNKVADTCYTFWVGGSLGVRPDSPFVSPCLGIAELKMLVDTKQGISPRFQWYSALSLGEDTTYDRRLWKDAWRSPWWVL